MSFLRAEWRKRALANYSVDPDVLKPYLPAHTACCTENISGFSIMLNPYQ